MEKMTTASPKVLKDMSDLLAKAEGILQHHKERNKSKSEKYNVFSILGLGHHETRLHSNLLANLLNQNGSHGQEQLFVTELLEHLKERTQKELSLNLTDLMVEREYYIGKINEDYSEGGLVDILLQDKEGNSICIENKIYAPEQLNQIARYRNFNKEGVNTVFYLTLFGDPPTYADGLKQGEDYYLLSYKDDIANWLTNCLSKYELPERLKSTLRQYLETIQKLTNTKPQTAMDKDVKKLIIENRSTAKLIVKEYSNVLYSVRKTFKNAVVAKLEQALVEQKIDLTIQEGGDVDKYISQIWLLSNKNKLHFGIESFSGTGHYNGNMFVGLFTRHYNSDLPEFVEITKNKPHKHWSLVQHFDCGLGRLNLSQDKFLQAIADESSDEFQDLVNLVVNTSIDFIKEVTEKLDPRDRSYNL